MPRHASRAESPTPTSPQVRVIKKYPNRRLYDTLTSSYITLADIKKLVMSGESFNVVDAKSQEDLTRSILLQIILEEELGGVPVFSETALANIIRFYGHASQGFNQAQTPAMLDIVGNYVDQSRQVMTQMQEQMQRQTDQMLLAMGLKR